MVIGRFRDLGITVVNLPNDLWMWHSSCTCCCSITSVVSESVWPHGRQPTRLPRSWDSPGKNPGVGYHFLLQCMKVKSESEATQSCQTLSDPKDCSLLGSSVHGIFQARVLEWGAIAFSVHQPRQGYKQAPCSILPWIPHWKARRKYHQQFFLSFFPQVCRDLFFHLAVLKYQHTQID